MAKLQSGTIIYGSANVNSQLFVLGSNASTSNITGALIVSGGVGVSGNISSNGSINSTSFFTSAGLNITGQSNAAYGQAN